MANVKGSGGELLWQWLVEVPVAEEAVGGG